MSGLGSRKTNHHTGIAATLSKLFILLGVFSAVTCFQLVPGWQAQRSAIIAQQNNIASDAAQQVSGFIERMFDLLDAAAQIGNPLSDDVQARRLLLETLPGMQPALRDVAVLDSHGQELDKLSHLTSTGSTDLGGWADTNLFAQVSRKRRYIGSVRVEEAADEPFVTLAVPLQNVHGDFAGALVADVSLKFTWDLIASVQAGRGGLAYIVDERGHLIACGDPSLVLQGKNLSTLEPVAGFIGGRAEQSHGISTGIGGNLVLWTCIPLGEPNWAVVVETPVAEAYRASLLNAALSLVGVFIVLILVVAVSALIARRLAVPLYELTETATRIAGKEAESRAPVQDPDEIPGLTEALNNMTARLRARNIQLQTAAEVSKSVSTILDTGELLARTVNLIREQFDFYYVGIFLVDEDGEYAVLRAGSGEAGRQMIEAGHRLAVGGDSMIGWCVAHGEPRIALDVGEEAIRFDNPLLPQTRSEMALPLVLHSQVIGALTVQSVIEAAFSEDDVTALQSMAGQLAIAIENAGLYEKIRQYAADLEQRVAGRTAELVAVNKELESFAYSVSHDLRAPLRSIDGFSRALLEDYDDKLDAIGQDYLRRVRAASQRMGQLIDGLLQLSRVTRGGIRYGQVDLSDLAWKVVAELRATQPERRATFIVEPGLVVEGDARLLLVVLENLLGNAWKFTSRHPSARVEFGSAERDGERVYFVRDDGAGFDMAYSDKLFGAFQRLHARAEFDGTGVGLATVQRIIRRHGGQVWAEGAVEQGATFYFTLPLGNDVK